VHAWGLRLRRVLRALALPCPPVLPSALLNCVGTLVAIISQLDTQPACAPVNASRPTLRLATHDSGSGWLATPFLYGSYIHYSMPVYPGALNKLLIGTWARSPIRVLFSTHGPTRTAEFEARGRGLEDGAMKITSFAWAVWLFLLASVSPCVAQQAAKIAQSGTTIISVASSSAKASAEIQTVRLSGDCARLCPASRVWVDTGVESATIVQRLRLSIGPHTIFVPLSVYASLFEPRQASLKVEKGSFVLTIGGADGGESYFVQVYFDAGGVNRTLTFNSEFPDAPLQDTHYYPNKDRGE
jgi:hypothetical protein